MQVEMYERLRGRVRDPRTEANCLGLMGVAYFDTGRLSQAVSDLRRCIAITEQVDGPNAGAAWWCDLACCLRDMGQTQEALQAHEKTLSIDQFNRDWSGVGTDLNNVAECYADCGFGDLARRTVSLSLAALPYTDGNDGKARSLHGYRRATLAKFLLDAGSWAEAAVKANEALEIGAETTNSVVLARSGYFAALAALAQGDSKTALEKARLSLAARYPRFNFRSLLLCGIAHLAGGNKTEAKEAFALCVKECEHLALGRCGLFACGQLPDLRAAKDILMASATLKQYPGIRARCLHLLRLIAKHDPTRQVARLALLIEGSASPQLPSPAQTVLDSDAVRSLRAGVAPVLMTKLHSQGRYAQCAETAADAVPVMELMPPPQRREFMRVRAWAQARRGFLDGPEILNTLDDDGYVQSLQRISDYMAVYRYQGLTPAAEVGAWFERGLRLASEANTRDPDIMVLLNEYQGCALLAANQCEAAQQLLQEALAGEKAGRGEVRILARLNSELGEASRVLGDLEKAEGLSETAAAFQEEHGFEGDLCEYTLPNLAKLRAGQPVALEHLAQARTIAERLHHPKALLRIMLIEARVTRDASRASAIFTTANALASALPAVSACPLWRRIQGSWPSWCAGIADAKADHWGI
jgi:tetratricopeptide (TPR) repeat protein